MPFGFVLGKTTLQEAEAKWAEEISPIVGRGYAAIGAAAGVDGRAEHSANRIYLVDVDSVAFEGVRRARFVFFDDVLYSVQSVLKSIIDPRKANSPQELSEQELQDLEKQIRQQYGPPNHAYRDISAGKKPNVLVWDYGSNTFTVGINAFPRSQIIYTNMPEAKNADAYKKKLCRSIPGC